MSQLDKKVMTKLKEMEKLTKSAISSTLIKPNLSLFDRLSKMVNSNPNIPKEYIKILRTQVSSVRNIRSQKMLLNLLEFLTCRCNRKFHVELNSRLFLKAINSIFNRKLLNKEIKSKPFSSVIWCGIPCLYNLPNLTADQTLKLIQFWNVRFENEQDLLPNFNWYYNVVKSKGVEFPAYQPSDYEPTEAPPPKNRNLPIDYSDDEPQQRPRQAPSFSDDYLDVSSFNEKKQKLYKDLLVVLENIDLTNSIMNEKGDKEIVKTMVGNLNQMENKFDALKRKLKVSGERELFGFTDDLLKEIMKIYQRANTFLKSRKPSGYYLARQTLTKKCRI